MPETTAFSVSYKIESEESWLVEIVIAGDISSIDLTGSSSPELWRATCFELFYKNPEEEAYCELNVAPDGRCTHVELESYRKIIREIPMKSNPAVQIKTSSDMISIQINLNDFDLEQKEIAVAVITADSQGVRRFWGIDHWDGNPDFHREENFFVFCRLPHSTISA